ncbi:hypothetical protein D9758_009678 [Tetrapyrgos nigripes]|uniref:Uncharacterized protein n=1 Tax=Tetrapyrgos nigripes TaxID=182062 RepID=A0A8H5FQ82_9AGAR|nr:hypothetical protein D9758_009678 [Tetrapyrgos nigripes]
MSLTMSAATSIAHQNSPDRVSANEQRDPESLVLSPTMSESTMSGPQASPASTSPDATDDLERTVSPVHTTSIHAIVTQTQSRSLSLQMFSHSSNSHISDSVLSIVGGNTNTTNNHHNNHHYISIFRGLRLFSVIQIISIPQSKLVRRITWNKTQSLPGAG